jgi:hypothetical protein
MNNWQHIRHDGYWQKILPHRVKVWYFNEITKPKGLTGGVCNPSTAEAEQEDGAFQASLGYIENSRPEKWDLVSKNQGLRV